jgi:hypothetical protein
LKDLMLFKMPIVPKVIYKLNIICVKIPKTYFAEIEKKS